MTVNALPLTAASTSPLPETSPTAGAAPATIESARFTLDHYEHLVACGAFDGEHNKPWELVWGVLIEMPPIGPPHRDGVDRLTEWSVTSTVGTPMMACVQQPIRLPSSESSPEPDIAWVKRGRYGKRHPNPDEVLLVIEVADSSLRVDLGPKLAAYADAGIAEYWVVNRPDRTIEVFREPEGRAYNRRRVVKRGETIAPLAAPEAALAVADLFVEG